MMYNEIMLIHVMNLFVLVLFTSIMFYTSDASPFFYGVGAFLFILYLWQLFFPLFKNPAPVTPKRQTVNYALNFIVGNLTTLPVIFTSVYVAKNKVGLFYMGELPGVIIFIIGICALDLVTYFTHKMGHEFSFFWRFHQIHHNDHIFETSLYTREHPISGIIAGLTRSGIVFCLGISPQVTMAYFYAQLIALIFFHSNIYYPKWIDRLLSLVIFTPRLHVIHHSLDEQKKKVNYGILLTWWDRIFSTYQGLSAENQEETAEALIGDKKNIGKEISFLDILTMPFK